MPTLQPGTRFAGLEVEALLGRGGFATVYAARSSTDGPVALKILDPDEGSVYDARTRARFQREVAILAGLTSPHIVRLLDHGESDGLLYMVFEYLPGRDLDELLESARRLEPAQVVAVLGQVLEGLREAHGVGLLHRDLKPQNIRVINEGGPTLVVKLIDFGIARSTDAGHPSITKTGELIGTPRYMSPEQLLGKPLGPASDLYSLGMVAFEMLMGRDALAGDDVFAQVERLHTGHLFSLPSLAPAHAGLVAVIQRMTARRVEERFASALAVSNALGAPSEPKSSASSASVPAARAAAPATTRGLLLMLFGLIVAIALASYFVWKAGSARETVETQPTLPTALVKVTTPSAPPTHVHVADVGSDARPVSLPDGGSAGCGEPAPFEGRGRLSGVITYLPSGYRPDRAHPVLLLIHHKRDLPAKFVDRAGFAELAEQHQFIIVAPNNGTRGWSGTHVPMVRDALERVAKRVCVDHQRVYAVGQAKGARVVLSMACEPWVTAIGVNSNLPGQDYADEVWCDRPKPTIWLSPMDSKVVPHHGSGSKCSTVSLSVDELEVAWRKRNRCGGTAQAKRRDGGVCTTWTCDAAFESCRIDGGHWWPGMPHAFSDEFSCRGERDAPDFATAERIWNFFETIPPLEH